MELENTDADGAGSVVESLEDRTEVVEFECVGKVEGPARLVTILYWLM